MKRPSLIEEEVDRLLADSEYRRQQTDWTCGPTAAREILLAYGLDVTEAKIARIMKTTYEDGTDGDLIEKMFKDIGFETHQVSADRNSIQNARKAIANGWSLIMLIWTRFDVGHFVAVKEIDDQYITLSDPMNGPNHTHRVGEFVDDIWFTKDSEGNKFRRWMVGVKYTGDLSTVATRLNELDPESD